MWLEKGKLNMKNETNVVENVVEKPESKTKIDFVKYYKVLLHNDEINSFEYVKEKVQKVFRFTEEEAFKAVMEAHSNDYAICIVEPFEHAERHKEILASFNIFSSIEPN